MELTEVVGRRRMTRNFSGRPLDPGALDGLLALALRAPSAGNAQGREFVALEGPETAAYWDATTDAAWRARSRRFEGLRRAPAVVLVFADPGAYAARYREPDKAGPEGVGAGPEGVGVGADPTAEWPVPFWFVDAGFSVMTLLLGAADLGLGAAFLGNFRGETALRTALGVPGRFRWLGAVLLGEAAEPDPSSASVARPRRTVDSVHRGAWSSPG